MNRFLWLSGLFKIFDLEEREDIKIAIIRHIIKKKENEADKTSIKKLPNGGVHESITKKSVEYPTNRGFYQEILNGTISGRIQPRGDINFFHNNLKDSINEMFISVRQTYSGEKRFEVLNNLDWVFNELMIVKDYLTKYTPDRWNIFQEYFDI